MNEEHHTDVLLQQDDSRGYDDIDKEQKSIQLTSD